MSNIEKIRQEIERRLQRENEILWNAKKRGTYPSPSCEYNLLTLTSLRDFIDSLTEESENHGCGVEFPHFGANYPDAKCIDGYLWDMDSYEDGIYTIGGDDPCPICNTEKWLKDVLDDEIFKTRDEALEYVKMLKTKYKHKDFLPDENNPEPYNPVYDEEYLNEKIAKATKSWKGVDVNKMLADCRGYEEKPSDELEEAAWDCVLDSIDVNNPVLLPKYKELLLYLFIAGAEWRKKSLTVEDIQTILDISFWNNDPEKILEEYNRLCDTSKVTRR